MDQDGRTMIANINMHHKHGQPPVQLQNERIYMSQNGTIQIIIKGIY